MTADPRTIAVYDARAADYANRFDATRPDPHLRRFISVLPKGARVLDLGCGPAQASAFMREAGLDPDPIDASPAMVALANDRHDIGARIATFDDIDAVAEYDAVWANFSLLHAARADLPRHLAALHLALKPGGHLHIAMKTGSGEARDGIDRLYTFVTVSELCGLLADTGFIVTETQEGVETGLAGTEDPYVIVSAHG
jgi:SAM-dependent methyltransferase